MRHGAGRLRRDPSTLPSRLLALGDAQDDRWLHISSDPEISEGWKAKINVLVAQRTQSDNKSGRSFAFAQDFGRRLPLRSRLLNASK